MRNVKGFTLIEVIIVIAIVGILGTIGYGAYEDSNKPPEPTMQCISGYTFTNTKPPTQIISEDGTGVPCRDSDFRPDTYNTWEY